MTTSTCNLASGTYACQRPAGHTGDHVNRTPIVSSSNVRTGTRVARFADKYAPVRISNVSA